MRDLAHNKIFYYKYFTPWYYIYYYLQIIEEFYCPFEKDYFYQFILLFSLFLLLFNLFLLLFMSLTILFQLIFIFIYNIFSKKFSILKKIKRISTNTRKKIHHVPVWIGLKVVFSSFFFVPTRER